MDVRKRIILRAVVDRYIERAEPVGSKTLSEGQDLSPATLRNEMAVLEEMGYLEHPHTSAGRVPTPKGYRLYVDELMERHRLSLLEMEEINRAMRERLSKLDRLLDESAELLARLTRYASVAMGPAGRQKRARILRLEAFMPDSRTAVFVAALNTGAVKTVSLRVPDALRPVSEPELRALAAAMPDGVYTGRLTPLESAVRDFCEDALIEEGEVRVHGQANLLDQPEYHDIRRVRRTLEYLADNRKALAAALRARAGPREPDVVILIGAEDEARAALPEGAAVVAVRCDMGGGLPGVVGVVGPTRMDYARLASRLSYFAAQLAKRLKE